MKGARRRNPTLPERRDVVHHVEAAPVGRDDEVALFNRDVVHRRVGQVLAQRLPFRPVVERDVDAVLGAEIQQLRALDVLADRAREVVRRKAVGDGGPGFPEVVGPEHVRLEVVLLIAVRRDVRRAGAERRRLDEADAREVSQPLRRHVLPARSAVARHLHEAVVGTRPDHGGVLRRRCDGEDGRVGFDTGVVLRDRTARRPHGLRIVACQVGADPRPALAFVGRLPDMLRADVRWCPRSVGAITIGNVHWNRSVMSAEA